MAVIVVDCVVFVCDTCLRLSAPTPVDEQLPLSWSEDQLARHGCPNCTAHEEPQ